LVLVDNGSSDASLQLFEEFNGPKRLVSNPHNQSFSVANNQGIRAASGDLVLLANNDIEPVHPDWLGYMVESLTPDVGAVGAMLVYPRRPKGRKPPAYPDLTIQHLGVGFEYSKWGVRAVNKRSGEDPLSISGQEVRDVPGVTAACLLARRQDLLASPFDETYWYGSEDWDLCLRLNDRGRIVLDERAVLFHYEFGTQDRFMSESWLENRKKNHQWFNELWGPSLMRRLRMEAARPRSEWFFRGDNAPSACVISQPETGTEELANRLREEAEKLGWSVRADEKGRCDVAIAVAPPNDPSWFGGIDTSIAVVTDQESDWARSGNLDAAKSVVVSDPVVRARLEAIWGSGLSRVESSIGETNSNLFSRLLETAAPRADSMRIGVSTCAPNWERARFWGDTHLARALMRSFRRLGHEANELNASDWTGAKAASCDIVIHLRGLTRRPVARGQWNLLWIISHPDRLEPGECDDYDLIASASRRHAEELSAELGRPVHYIAQATDADTFKAGPRDAVYEDAVLYVGNARRPHRLAPRWLMRNNREFQLYGRLWDSFPEAEFVRGEYIANQDLAMAYRSAAVVVADHHGSMRTDGFLANRLFDVLASGGVVLSDDVAGLNEVFGELIPTYSDAGELESQLRSLLADSALRRRLAAEGRHLVVSGHTLDHRARQWLELLDRL
jgi:GT2 family glycosyltransferase